MISIGLGEAEIKQRQKDGWTFSDRGLRIGNGWMVWARDPAKNLHLILLADPDDEPEKFSQKQAEAETPQLTLPL